MFKIVTTQQNISMSWDSGKAPVSQTFKVDDRGSQEFK